MKPRITCHLQKVQGIPQAVARIPGDVGARYDTETSDETQTTASSRVLVFEVEVPSYNQRPVVKQGSSRFFVSGQ